MTRSPRARLVDIVEAIELIRSEVSGLTLSEFQSGKRVRWLVERGIEIISESSRHLPEEMKLRHPLIPWRKVAGIGNVLRHDYEHVAPDIIWRVSQDDLAVLLEICREEPRADRDGPLT